MGLGAKGDASPSRESFLKEKDETLLSKQKFKKLKTHRGCRDSFATERFDINLNLL